MILKQNIRKKFERSRLFSVCCCVVFAFIIDIVFWIFIQDEYKLSDFIVTLLSGLTFGLFLYEIIKPLKSKRTENRDKTSLNKNEY